MTGSRRIALPLIAALASLPVVAVTNGDSQPLLNGALIVTLPPDWESLGAPDDDTVLLLRRTPYIGHVGLAAGDAVAGAQGWASTPPPDAVMHAQEFMGQPAQCYAWQGDAAEFEQDRAIRPGQYRLCLFDAPLPGGVPIAVRIAGLERFHASEGLARLLDSLRIADSQGSGEPRNNATLSVPSPDGRIPELVALAAQGRLTVRALRAFGQLPAEYGAVALALYDQGLDLYAADARRIRVWLEESAAGTRQLPAAAIEPLNALTLQLRGYEPAGQVVK
jgi:hypothetical protein